MPAPAHRVRLLVSFFAATAPSLFADWRDEVGYTRLNQTFTSGVPTAVAAGVTQVEAPIVENDTVNYYLPDFANSAFSGKTLTNKSSGTGASGHATTVGGSFYGNFGSLVSATASVDAYNANGWLNSGFLNYGTASDALIESRRVQNHSWISIFSTTTNTPAQISAAVANIDQRLDLAINRDGFSSAVGVNNGASTTLPDLLCQSYHTVSVGLVGGGHSHGLTAYDVAGRMKPDLVAFSTLTSFATPQVASAAGLVSEKLRTDAAISAVLATADYPRLTKALLLAGAAKEPLASWSRADTAKPYDATYGAGALNIFLAYRTLLGGQQSASGSALAADTGWAVASVRSATAASSRTYYFDISSRSVAVPFSAALTWHRTFSPSVSLANLDLRLYAVGPGSFTLGGQIDASVSTVDNVEHIYQAELPPGRYALQVSNSGNNNTAYALSWRTSPAVTLAATTPTAREQDGSAGVFTVTREGPTTSPLFVPLAWGGTAVSGTHYTAPPASLLIPAGAASATVSISPMADSLAQGDRTVTLTVATDYSLSAGSPASATVTIEDKPYDAWRFSHFTSPQLAAPSTSGDSADPDGDGLSNLLEYALGGEPLASDAPARQPSVANSEDGRLALTYFQPAARSDLAYAIEWTDDLAAGSWQNGASVVTEIARVAATVGDTAGELVTVRANATSDAAPRQFLRLRVTRQ